MSFKKFDGSVWQSINPKQLKGTPYTGTLPAVLAGTKAGHLHKYKIYGNLTQNGTPTPENPIYPSECGERTANRFDTDTIYSAYKQADGTYQGTVNNFYTLHPTPFTADDIGKEFTFAIKVNATTSGNIRASANVNGTSINGNGLSAPGITKVTFTVSSTSDYLYLNYGSGGGNQITISDIMLSEGQTALPYEPYGYKLPLLSGSTHVDIYIGDDTLSTGEYIDSGTGKIYRMVDGVLTPVDPPISFPQIPTSAGSTTISWAGSGLAPSEFDSIQEWVDISTYTYTNGEWVADN